MTFDNITTAWPLAKAGKLRALGRDDGEAFVDRAGRAHAGRIRAARLRGRIVARRVRARRNAAPIIKRLNAEIVKILHMPEVNERLAGLGAEIVADSPEEFAALVKAEVVKWAEVVKQSGAKVD